jgi:hypothetical protein
LPVIFFSLFDSRLPAHNLSHGSQRSFQVSFKIVDDFPVLKALEKFPLLQHMLRAAGSAKPCLGSRVGLVDQKPPLAKGRSYEWNQGSMEVAKYQDGAIAVLRKGVGSRDFQIDFPGGDLDSMFGGNSFGFVEPFGCSIATDDLKVPLSYQYAIVTFTARQVQDGTGRDPVRKQMQILDHQGRGRQHRASKRWVKIFELLAIRAES